MTVIPFTGKPEEQIWVCLCGCSTFELMSSGSTRCASCGTVSQDNGGWHVPDTDIKYTGPEPFQDVQGNGNTDFSRRRIANRAMDADSCCVVIVLRNGTVSTWADIETLEQCSWIEGRLLSGAEVIRTALKGKL